MIAQSFLDDGADRRPGPTLQFSEEAADLMTRARWSGNVRELKNIVERVAIFADGPLIGAEELLPHLSLEDDALELNSTSTRQPVTPPPVPPPRVGTRPATPPPLPTGEGLSLKEAKESLIADFEKDYLLRLLQQHNHNVSAVAREAGIDRRHVYRLLEKYDLPNPRKN